MAISPSASLPDTEKLDVLRRLDQFRQWHSLDDKRFCLVCGKIITGRQIEMVGDSRGNGPLRLSCPTERCNSIPMDWVLPTDEILSVAEIAASQEAEVALPPAVDHDVTEGPPSRPVEFAIQFKRAS